MRVVKLTAPITIEKERIGEERTTKQTKTNALNEGRKVNNTSTQFSAAGGSRKQHPTQHHTRTITHTIEQERRGEGNSRQIINKPNQCKCKVFARKAT